MQGYKSIAAYIYALCLLIAVCAYGWCIGNILICQDNLLLVTYVGMAIIFGVAIGVAALLVASTKVYIDKMYMLTGWLNYILAALTLLSLIGYMVSCFMQDIIYTIVALAVYIICITVIYFNPWEGSVKQEA